MAIPKKKKGTDWRPKVYPKCLWQKGRMWRKSDEAAYFAYFKPQIEKVATKMVRDYSLPDSNFDDLVSDGLLALARVPCGNRWSGPYVFRCVVNRMRDGLQQAKTRWSRYELWAEVPDVIPAPDGIDGRIAVSQMVEMLGGEEAEIMKLHLQGFETKEIATKLGIESSAVKSCWESAVEQIKRRINPQESL